MKPNPIALPHGFSLKNKTTENPQKLKEVCQEFESFFIYYMLKTMRQTVPKSDLLGGGMAKEIYTSMLDEQLAQKVAKAGGIGLAKILLRQFEKAKVGNSAEQIHKMDDSLNRLEKGGKQI